MKKPRTKVPARRQFKEQLAAYSTLSRAVGAAAVVTTAAATLGTAPAADAQVVNLTAASFGVAAVSGRVGEVRIASQLIGAGTRFSSQLLAAGPIQFQGHVFQQNRVSGFFAEEGSAGFNGIGLEFAAHPGGSTLLRIAPGGPGSPINGLASWRGSAFGFRTQSNNFNSLRSGRNPVGDFFGSLTATVAGYIGFRVATAGHHAYQYGWLRIGVENGLFIGNRPQGISLIEEYGTGVVGAYNLTPGGAIYAGEVAAIPEPSTVATGLGLFALGAVGVREFRRRRQQAA